MEVGGERVSGKRFLKVFATLTAISVSACVGFGAATAYFFNFTKAEGSAFLAQVLYGEYNRFSEVMAESMVMAVVGAAGAILVPCLAANRILRGSFLSFG